MKYLLLILPLLVACSSTEDIVNSAYRGLCDRQPESMSCVNHEYIGYAPSFYYVNDVANEMSRNFIYASDTSRYGVDEYWFDGEKTSIKLIGDCDDISLTFISQLILDGVAPSNIRLVASGINGKLKHYYARVKLDDDTYYNFYIDNRYTDIMYMQYDNIGVFKK